MKLCRPRPWLREALVNPERRGQSVIACYVNNGGPYFAVPALVNCCNSHVRALPLHHGWSPSCKMVGPLLVEQAGVSSLLVRSNHRIFRIA
jgi:hypothetical protein